MSTAEILSIGKNEWNMASEVQSVRIGAVRYLNSKPLIEGLVDDLSPEGEGTHAAVNFSDSPRMELILDYPSRLADDLAQGNLDVALIPSVEYTRNSDYEIVSNACVAAHGPVFSVKLYCRTHPGDIKRLALDEGSRTSATLAQVMLNHKYGVQPELISLPIENSIEQTDADAVLLIGDRAMHIPEGPFHEVWDLGEEWTNWTGLPFVFAMWVVRRDFNFPEVEQALCVARDRGIASINQIAQREAAGLGLSETAAVDYLRTNLHFKLGGAERRGLQLFNDLAAKQGLVPRGVNLVFRHCSDT